MQSQTRAYAFASTTVLFWSTVATAFKLTLPYTGVLQLLLISSATSTLALFVIVLLRRTPWSGWTARSIAVSAFTGFLNPFLYYIVLFEAYERLPAQQAQTLNYLWPIVLVLFSVVFLKQRLSLRIAAAFAAGFTGVLLIATEGNFLALEFRDPAGVALALSSTVIWAGYWIMNMRERRDKIQRLFLNFAFGTVYILILSIVSGQLRPAVWQGIAGGIYAGLFEMGITFYTWMCALESADSAAGVSNLVYLSPFISLLFIALVLGEAVLPATIAGLALIIAGIVIQQYRSGQQPQST